MIRKTRFALALGLVAVTASITSVSHADYQPPTALMGGGTFIPLPDAAMIVRTEGGFRYIAGQQDSHLTVTAADGKLSFADTGTEKLKDIPRACTRQSVTEGIAAVCRIPAKFADMEMYVEVWPRLGDDFVDGSTLSDAFRLWVLADAGLDEVHGGAGDDFVNGAHDRDRAWGGAGDDWIRTGTGDDEIWGDGGNDKLVGTDGADTVHGGDGTDRVDGGPGKDQLYADDGAGSDIAACGTGTDTAYVDAGDKATACESVTRS